jgi:hypothetical protein
MLTLFITETSNSECKNTKPALYIRHEYQKNVNIQMLATVGVALPNHTCCTQELKCWGNLNRISVHSGEYNTVLHTDVFPVQKQL